MVIFVIITYVATFVGGGYVGWLYGKRAQAVAQKAINAVAAAAKVVKQ